jgi:hypothetical protein
MKSSGLSFSMHSAGTTVGKFFGFGLWIMFDVEEENE